MDHANENKNVKSGVTDGQVVDSTDPEQAEAVHGAIEELEKSAEDWVNQLPETLQDEP